MLLALGLAAMPRADAVRARELETQAHELQAAGQYAEAEQPLLEAIELWSRHYGPAHIEVLNDEISLGLSYQRRGEPARGIPLLEHAVEELKRSSDPDAPEIYRQGLNNLAIAYLASGRREEARTTFEKCLAMLEQGEVTPLRARVLNNLANVLLAGPTPDYAGAARYSRRALEERTALQGEEDADVAIATTTLGVSLMRQGDLAGARPLLERGRVLMQTIRGAEHPETGSVLYLLGELEQRSGNRRAAREHYEAALAIARKNFGQDSHPQVQDALRGLAALDAESPMAKARPVVVIAIILVLLATLRKSSGRLAPQVAITPVVYLLSRWPVLLSWAAGATGVFLWLLPGAIARGDDSSISGLATLGGMSLFLGLGVVVLVVLPIWLITKALSPIPTFELEAGESVVREVVANHFLDGESRGGRLLITDRRLGFCPNRFNLQVSTWSIRHDEIESVHHEGQQLLVIGVRGAAKPEWLLVFNASALESEITALIQPPTTDEQRRQA
ncbi:tetratricopeptide repeat protein [Corallococcus interemptor]|uniref:tetratricopeptide repeat protein n=1 Tax=Corallococcus interemptor TaxID=2316720 RepID=UPI003CFF9371